MGRIVSRIIGGLHFPVPEGRIMVGPLDVQRRLASGDGLLSPLTMDQVEQQIALLRSYDPAVIGVSPHDSSDEVIGRVKQAFGAAYRHIRVGEAIVIDGGTSP